MLRMLVETAHHYVMFQLFGKNYYDPNLSPWTPNEELSVLIKG